MDEHLLQEISDKLDKLIRLAAVPAMQGKNIEQSILFLDALDFRPVEIATVLGKTTNQVNVTLSNYRKKTIATADSAPSEQDSRAVTSSPESKGD